MTVTHPDGAARVQRSRLSAALVDGITEVVALPPDPSSRAAAIAGLVQEICEALTWVDTSTTYRQELASFARVLAEVHHHEDRMAAVQPVPAAEAEISRQQALAAAGQLDEQVSSYDDLFVFTDPAGRVAMECPVCGLIPIPLRETTLSDLTNAAMDHLSEQHPYTLTLPSARTADSPEPAPARASVTRDGEVPGGHVTDHFWSLIAQVKGSRQ